MRRPRLTIPHAFALPLLISFILTCLPGCGGTGGGGKYGQEFEKPADFGKGAAPIDESDEPFKRDKS